MNFFFMKKFILPALLIAILAPCQACAEYKAQLKSGEELYAADYWVDKIDNQLIRLEINGSMERMPRNLFLYIAPVPPGDRHVRTAIKRITFAPKERFMAAPPEAGSAAETTANSEPQPPQQPQQPQTAENSWRNEAERIDREREAAKDDFRKALNNSDFSMRQQARQRILDLTAERSKLLEKVKVASNGEIPDWWRWKTEN